MKNIRAFLLTALLAILTAGVVAQISLLQTPPALAPQPEVQAPPKEPIEIESIKERKYLASPINTQRILGNRSGNNQSIVSYDSDGFKIYALLSLPSGVAPEGGWPVIILLHGYIRPEYYRTDSKDYAGWIASLGQAGYAVIKPDFRGNGASEGQPEGGHFSPAYAYDTLNLVESIKTDTRFNASRIGLVGHSMGGHIALRALVVSEDIKAAAIMAGVVGSMYDLFYNWPNSPVAGDLPEVAQSLRVSLLDRYKDPQTNPDFWDKASAINYVGDISASVQINHASADSMVPALFSEHLATALREAGKDVDYRIYPGDDHQFVINRRELSTNFLEFFRAKL